MTNRKFPLVSTLLIVLVLLTAIGSSIYFFYRFKTVAGKLEHLKTTKETTSQDEAKKLIDKVGKLIELPTDEKPTIATVADLKPLKDRPFFSKAKVGDKVLIYLKAKKAILYDPKANKILEVGGISLPSPTISSPLSPSTALPTRAIATFSATFNFTLRNGTELTGLAKLYQKELKEKVPAAKIIAIENAVSQNYDKTILVDIQGDKKEDAQRLAKTLGIILKPLPKEENKPDSDFLIIVGDDKKNLWLLNL